MNKLSEAAAILGKKGGEAGTGDAKARSSKQARTAVLARWGNLTPEQRFWSNVKRGAPDECWEWQKCQFKSKWTKVNYGCTRFAGKTQFAHRVAWMITHGPIPKGIMVLHDCDNRPCCNPAHLFLGTAKDNAQDRDAKGRQNPARGAALPFAKLTDQIVTEMRLENRSGVLQKDLAAKYGVSKSVIAEAINGTTWAHVPNPIPKGSRRNQIKGDGHHQSKLTSKSVKSIRQMRADGIPAKKIASIYGVLPSSIQAIVNRKTWRHI